MVVEHLHVLVDAQVSVLVLVRLLERLQKLVLPATVETFLQQLEHRARGFFKKADRPAFLNNVLVDDT